MCSAGASLNYPDDSRHQIPFGQDEAAAAAAACRESIVDIIRGSIGHDGEIHPNPADDPAVLPLARIAFHVVESSDPEITASDLDMHFLKFALKRFSDAERTKRAVHESTLRFGVINNAEIEQRVTLGAVAGRLLMNLDPDFAEASMEEAKARFLSIAS